MSVAPLQHRRPGEQGYGLIVIAALFTAFAAIAAASLSRNAAEMHLGQQWQARQQLSRLAVALVKYARYHDGRFPCPASYLIPPGDGDFGKATVGCHGGGVPSGTRALDAPANLVIQGMVPVYELVPYGIAAEDAFDPWSARITYTVHGNRTTGAGSVTVTEASRPQVTLYTSGAVLQPSPDFVLLSHGADRMGARLRQQSSLASPAIACAATADRRYANCKGTDKNFITGPLYAANNAPSSEYYDDLVSFYRY